MSITDGVINAIRRRLSELERKVVTILLQLATLGANWTSHDPQIDQGASTDISHTVQYSKYLQIGNTVMWNFCVTLTAGGTAGSALTLTLPVTAANANGALGSGMIYDADTVTRYAGSTLNWITAAVIALAGDWAGASAWGGSPNLAAASGDVFQGFVIYEAA